VVEIAGIAGAASETGKLVVKLLLKNNNNCIIIVHLTLQYIMSPTRYVLCMIDP